MKATYSIRQYQTQNGKIPFADWMRSLRDARAKAKIWQRIARAENGNFGDHKITSDGVWEMRIDYGPGYRLYYAIYKNEIVILFCGGDKRNQDADIRQAINFKNDYEANQ